MATKMQDPLCISTCTSCVCVRTLDSLINEQCGINKQGRNSSENYFKQAAWEKTLKIVSKHALLLYLYTV